MMMIISRNSYYWQLLGAMIIKITLIISALFLFGCADITVREPHGLYELSNYLDSDDLRFVNDGSIIVVRHDGFNDSPSHVIILLADDNDSDTAIVKSITNNEIVGVDFSHRIMDIINWDDLMVNNIDEDVADGVIYDLYIDDKQFYRLKNPSIRTDRSWFLFGYMMDSIMSSLSQIK